MRLFSGVVLFFLCLSTYANGKYSVHIDLVNVTKDQVRVEIQTPTVNKEEIEYHMAKIVPGTYSISDFGRFVSDFKALDNEGKILEVERLSTNKWKIKSAAALHKITYLVDDTFDQFDGYGGNIVFEPGGTNIEVENQVFVLNTFGFIGYLEGLKFHPYELNITHKEGLYGATALERIASSPTSDTFSADDFNFLADGPLMYCAPDTAIQQIANANIIVSVYSPNKKISAYDVMSNITDLMEAQSNYLGGKLPVDRYAYLIYLLENNSLSGSMGALEHSYSSLYTLPEARADRLAQTVRDVAAHEFFHIVTPLNIHSKEIGFFDYIDPKMSKHLWLYEGVTEYSAMHVQAKYGLYDTEEFLSKIKEKLLIRDRFPTDVSFTEMSERILEPEYEEMYANVYYKGALIGLCLDLHLLKYSNGAYDLQKLMRDLSEKYGKNTSFEDDQLFEDIVSLTNPEIGKFLSTYVSGTQPLPIVECLSWVGIDYKPSAEVETITLGAIELDVNIDQELYVKKVVEKDPFSVDMNYHDGDVIISLNGQGISLMSATEILEDFINNTNEGEKVKMVVRREVKGKSKKIKLKGKARVITGIEAHQLDMKSNPTEEQKKIRKSWLTTH
ncbi:MAG: PDZ domain-containing protein [Cyclobacteriaceae bacterium]|nr:PDZ domain-containing protein [Cyclobacteriaceae bacterium HetDA_MAG_MS6]